LFISSFLVKKICLLIDNNCIKGTQKELKYKGAGIDFWAHDRYGAGLHETVRRLPKFMKI